MAAAAHHGAEERGADPAVRGLRCLRLGLGCGPVGRARRQGLDGRLDGLNRVDLLRVRLAVVLGRVRPCRRGRVRARVDVEPLRVAAVSLEGVEGVLCVPLANPANVSYCAEK